VAFAILAGRLVARRAQPTNPHKSCPFSRKFRAIKPAKDHNLDTLSRLLQKFLKQNPFLTGNPGRTMKVITRETVSPAFAN
jgi:hypothetical protein